MCGSGVVTINTIFHQQLPVGPDAVFLRAAHHFHAGFGMVNDQVDIFACITQVVEKGHSFFVEADEPKADNLVTIKSPMIGTFYLTASPDSAPFVTEGGSVSAGKTVCIIEAMKLFNEIEAEISGKIVKILVANASPVEYDQPLFLVDPAG